MPDLLTAAELAVAKEDLRILRMCGSRDPRLRFMERAIATIEALEADLDLVARDLADVVDICVEAGAGMPGEPIVETVRRLIFAAYVP